MSSPCSFNNSVTNVHYFAPTKIFLEKKSNEIWTLSKFSESKKQYLEKTKNYMASFQDT